MNTAVPNVALLDTIVKGRQLATEPTPAARAFFADKLKAVRDNPNAHSAFMVNAWIPWRDAFSNPREWDSYTDKVANRRTDLGATSIMVDAHDVPGSIQNDPNAEQNELRLKRFRPNYRQEVLWQNRDEFTPVTIDGSEIMRLFREGGPDSTNVSDFAAAQITMATNRDKSAEFHTLMMSVGVFAGRSSLHHVQIPDLSRVGATADEARLFTTAIRTAVLALADFTPFYTPAGNTSTVPKSQVRLIIRQSVMQTVGALAYSNAFNPEYVFALPEDQIIELPDHYFDRQPALADQAAVIVDHGSDQAYGSLVVVDTFTHWSSDRFDAKSSDNRVYRHAEILDVNPFAVFITVGPGQGSQIITPSVVPANIAAALYGPAGIVENGALKRGESYSTRVELTDAEGYAAGGWRVDITSTPQSATKRTEIGLYNAVTIGQDDTASSITLRFSSLIDPNLFVDKTYNLTGPAAAYDGTGVLITSTDPSFNPGSGSGGAITYVTSAGELAQVSNDGGATWDTAPASPVSVPSGESRSFRKVAAYGYTYPGGVNVRTFGPYTAA